MTIYQIFFQRIDITITVLIAITIPVSTAVVGFGVRSFAVVLAATKTSIAAATLAARVAVYDALMTVIAVLFNPSPEPSHVACVATIFTSNFMTWIQTEVYAAALHALLRQCRER